MTFRFKQIQTRGVTMTQALSISICLKSNQIILSVNKLILLKVDYRVQTLHGWYFKGFAEPTQSRSFIQWLDTLHPTMKNPFTFYDGKTDYLDLMVFRTHDKKLDVCPFTKHNDYNTYLHFLSFHLGIINRIYHIAIAKP